MNDKLAALTAGVDGALKRGAQRVTPSGVGSYLNAVQAGTPRVQRYHQRLNDIAEKLRV
jgi:hypothetical protein